MVGGEEPIRLRNIADQKRLGTWSNIESAHIGAYTLYAFAPICKIRTLRTDDPYCSAHGGIVPLDYWRDTLAATQPDNLYLSIKSRDSVRRMDEVLSAIPNTVGKLRLRIDLQNWEASVEATFVSNYKPPRTLFLIIIFGRTLCAEDLRL